MPTVPVGSAEDVVIIIAGAIVTDRALVAVAIGVALSETCTVKLKVPAAVAVPSRTPALLKVSPSGKAPVLRLHV